MIISSYGIDEGFAYSFSYKVFPTDDVLMDYTIVVIQFGWLDLYNILLGGSLLLDVLFEILVVVEA